MLYPGQHMAVSPSGVLRRLDGVVPKETLVFQLLCVPLECPIVGISDNRLELSGGHAAVKFDMLLSVKALQKMIDDVWNNSSKIA